MLLKTAMAQCPYSSVGGFISHFHFLITASAYRMGSGPSWLFPRYLSPPTTFYHSLQLHTDKYIHIYTKEGLLLQPLFHRVLLSLSLFHWLAFAQRHLVFFFSFFLPPLPFVSLSLSGNNFGYRLHWSHYHCFISNSTGVATTGHWIFSFPFYVL